MADWLDDLIGGCAAFRGGAWDRARLVGILRQEPEQSATVDALRDDATVAVVAGQQPAVGGGPLYTLVKAAHAVAVAEALRARGQPAVALFWCASEDHDLGEAGHADLVRRDGRVERVTQSLGGGRASLRYRPARLWWDALVARCRERFGAGAGEAFLLAHAPAGDEGMGAWLDRCLGALFAGRLARVEAWRLRPLWQVQALAAATSWPTAALARERDRLLAAGRADSFGALDAPPFFADRPDGRVKLDAAQAATLAREAIGDLSPGAPLRPVLQQAAMPVACYLGGPGELAYHAFIGPLYAALGVSAPRLLPRASALLATADLVSGLAAWGLDPAAVDAGASPPPSTPGDPVAPPLARLDTAMAELARAAADRPRLSARLARLARARRSLDRGLRAEARADGRPAFGPLRDRILPRGQPQERVMSLFQAVWEHGPGLAPRLVEALAGVAPGARVVVAP